MLGARKIQILIALVLGMVSSLLLLQFGFRQRPKVLVELDKTEVSREGLAVNTAAIWEFNVRNVTPEWIDLTIPHFSCGCMEWLVEPPRLAPLSAGKIILMMAPNSTSPTDGWAELHARTKANDIQVVLLRVVGSVDLGIGIRTAPDAFHVDRPRIGQSVKFELDIRVMARGRTLDPFTTDNARAMLEVAPSSVSIDQVSDLRLLQDGAIAAHLSLNWLMDSSELPIISIRALWANVPAVQVPIKSVEK